MASRKIRKIDTLMKKTKNQTHENEEILSDNTKNTSGVKTEKIKKEIKGKTGKKGAVGRQKKEEKEDIEVMEKKLANEKTARPTKIGGESSRKIAIKLGKRVGNTEKAIVEEEKSDNEDEKRTKSSKASKKLKVELKKPSSAKRKQVGKREISKISIPKNKKEEAEKEEKSIGGRGVSKKEVKGLLEKQKDKPLAVSKKKTKKEVKGLLEKQEDKPLAVSKKKTKKEVKGLLEKQKDKPLAVSKKKRESKQEKISKEKKNETNNKGVKKTEKRKISASGNTYKKARESEEENESTSDKNTEDVQAVTVQIPQEKKQKSIFDNPFQIKNPTNIFENLQKTSTEEKPNLFQINPIPVVNNKTQEIKLDNMKIKKMIKLYPFKEGIYQDALAGNIIVCTDPLRILFVMKGIKNVLFDSLITYDTKPSSKGSRVNFCIIRSDKDKKNVIDLYAAKFISDEDAEEFYELIKK